MATSLGIPKQKKLMPHEPSIFIYLFSHAAPVGQPYG